MFSSDWRDPVTDRVKAGGSGTAWNWGTARPAGEGALVRLVEPEEHAHQQGGQQVGQIEEQPRRPAAEHPRPHRPQDEGGAAVVAEGQQPLRLGAGALAALIQLDGGAGPHRIAPHNAPRARAAAQAPFTRNSGAITGSSSRPRYRDIPSSTTSEDSTKKGNREGSITLPHRASARPPWPPWPGLRPQHQGEGPPQQSQPQQGVPVMLSAQDSAHGRHLLGKSLWRILEDHACPKKFPGEVKPNRPRPCYDR